MKILLFGITREIVGQNQLVIPSGVQLANVRQLKDWLGDKYPAIRSLSSLAVAVDSEYAGEDDQLSSGQEIALIPPVSGG
jgi:sulfur-carrier protein